MLYLRTMSYEPRSQIDLANELDAFLPPRIRAVLGIAANLAEQQGWRLYLVGGTVRDMLLGRAAGDLDLTVEGDAIGLADALAAQIGGRVTHHVQFGTAVLHVPTMIKSDMLDSSHEPDDALLMLDFVTARAEHYPAPAALPEVHPATLKEDLQRRDFAINALALGLHAADYGRLYDVTDGWHDLEQRQLRVLHARSFVDDPTRILRAIRLAARLECAIEPKTLGLALAAVRQGFLQRLSPARIFHELILVVEESEPAPVLELLTRLHVLAAIHPALRWRREMQGWFASARDLPLSTEERRMLGFALLVFAMDVADRAAFVASFPFDTPTMRVLRDITRIEQHIPALSVAQIARSKVDRLLDGAETTALWAARIVAPTACSSQIGLYQDVLRQMKPAIDGDDLRALGLPPGPQFRRLLGGLRAAYLDGIVTTREEQVAWVESQALV